MALGFDPEQDSPAQKKRWWEDDNIKFAKEDLEGIVQPHEDALVVTLRIGGFDVRRVMIDQGSRVEIMYPDLYEGLGLTSNDLTKYDSPLVTFDETVVTPTGQVTLLVEVGGRKDLVNFIVVHSYSPYKVILKCHGFIPWEQYLYLCIRW